MALGRRDDQRANDLRGQAGGGAAAADPFVWVSLRDPSPEELAAVQREFGLPAPLVDKLEWAFGYPLVLVVMVLICLALYRAFRRNSWL